MKAQRRQHRKINSIATGRWSAYAAAAAASSFAAAQSAEATIHYSGLVNQKVAGVHGFAFDLAGGVSLAVSHHWNYKGPSTSHGGGEAYFGIFGPGAAFKGTYSCDGADDPSASNLDPREVISDGPFFPGKAVLALAYGCHSYAGEGQFRAVGIGFVGFKFDTGAGVQYGWARINMQHGSDTDDAGPQYTFRLVDYAYGDPGEIVIAGQKESHSSAPILESLGGLALGGAGLLAWRRRRPALVH
jgi:MYXO-CTERM domain-containing protein